MRVTYYPSFKFFLYYPASSITFFVERIFSSYADTRVQGRTEKLKRGVETGGGANIDKNEVIL